MSESKLSDNNGHDQSRKLDMLPGLTKQNPEELEVNDDVGISELVHKIRLLQGPTSIPPRTIQEAKFRNYHFWSKEPVPELDSQTISENTHILTSDTERGESKMGPEPYSLPENYIWSDVEIEDAAQLDELYTFLAGNYVGDDENMFRFDYSREFLKWALMVPGWRKEWHLGVRLQSGPLFAFISAVPANIMIYGRELKMVEINFLCVQKTLRSKRIAPILIEEISRRVALNGIYQAIFTAGVVIPRPIGKCRYWHRSLDKKKLIDTNFSYCDPNMTESEAINLYMLPERTDSCLKPMQKEFLPSAYALVKDYLTKYSLAPVFSLEQFEHMMMPIEDVIYSYVIESDGNVTDLISFYCVPNNVINHPVHKQIKSAFSFYNVATTVPLPKLMHDALILAKNLSFDVFNVLDLMENKSFLDELKFAIGGGNLHYNLYNWKCPDMKPEQIGLILL